MNDISGEPERSELPSRERALTEVFVNLADTLVDDYDVVELLDQLVQASVDLLGVTAAGLLLDDQRGNLTVVASSGAAPHLLEVFQLQNNEGPCLDCVRSGVEVVTGDLEAQLERWPLFAPAALAAGFRSVVALPLRLRNEVIGGLNLFDTGSEGMQDHDRRLAQALADVATIGILQQRSAHRNTLLVEQLQHALNSRVVIEQAKGVLAERNNLDMVASFELLRGYARRHNAKLTQVASSVVRGELQIAPDS